MGKFHLYCSCVECRTELTTQNLTGHLKRHDDDKVVKGYCLECSSLLFRKNIKFCDQSCAATFNNSVRDYSIIRPGPKVGEGYRPPPYTKVSQCEYCNKWFAGRRKTCSFKCKDKLIGLKTSKAISNGIGGNKNRGRGRRSWMESSFEEWLNINYPNIEFIIEQPFKRYIKEEYFKTYFGDFFFPKLNLLIELDGSQHDSPRAKKYDKIRDKFISEEYHIAVSYTHLTLPTNREV